MKNHPHHRLSPFIDGELTEEERAEVARHLDDCAECAGLAEDLRVLAQAHAADPVPPVPAGLARRIRGTLEPILAAGADPAAPPSPAGRGSGSRRSSILRRVGPPVALAAALLSAGVLWIVWKAPVPPAAVAPELFGDGRQQKKESKQAMEESLAPQRPGAAAPADAEGRSADMAVPQAPIPEPFLDDAASPPAAGGSRSRSRARELALDSPERSKTADRHPAKLRAEKRDDTRKDGVAMLSEAPATEEGSAGREAAVSPPPSVEMDSPAGKLTLDTSGTLTLQGDPACSFRIEIDEPSMTRLHALAAGKNATGASRQANAGDLKDETERLVRALMQANRERIADTCPALLPEIDVRRKR